MSNITAEVVVVLKFQVGFQYFGAKGIDGIERIIERVESEARECLNVCGVEFEDIHVTEYSISDENGIICEEDGVPF